MRTFARAILIVLTIIGMQDASAEDAAFDPNELFRSLQSTINQQRSQGGMSELPLAEPAEEAPEEELPPPQEKPEIDLVLLAKRVHEIVNKERSVAGEEPLAWDDALESIAKSHSEDMALNNFTGHINLKGESPTDRGLKAGYRCRKKFGLYAEEGLSENICLNSLSHATKYVYDADGETQIPIWKTLDEIAESTVMSWMESEGHRMNMLDPHVSSEGIGIAIDERGKVYVTQIFC